MVIKHEDKVNVFFYDNAVISNALNIWNIKIIQNYSKIVTHYSLHKLLITHYISLLSFVLKQTVDSCFKARM